MFQICFEDLVPILSEQLSNLFNLSSADFIDKVRPDKIHQVHPMYFRRRQAGTPRQYFSHFNKDIKRTEMGKPIGEKRTSAMNRSAELLGAPTLLLRQPRNCLPSLLAETKCLNSVGAEKRDQKNQSRKKSQTWIVWSFNKWVKRWRKRWIAAMLAHRRTHCADREPRTLKKQLILQKATCQEISCTLLLLVSALSWWVVCFADETTSAVLFMMIW